MEHLLGWLFLMLNLLKNHSYQELLKNLCQLDNLIQVVLSQNESFRFLTAISHRGLRNCFFTLHLLFPISIWTFISHFLFGLLFPFFYLDFYLPFLFGLLFPFSIWTFISLFFLFSIRSDLIKSDQIRPNQTKSDQI